MCANAGVRIMVNYRKIVRRMSRDCLINTVLGWQPYKHCQRCEIEQRKTRDCAKRLYILGGRQCGRNFNAALRGELKKMEINVDEVRRVALHKAGVGFTNILDRMAMSTLIEGTSACMVVMDETFPEFVEPKVSIKHVPLEQWRRKGRKRSSLINLTFRRSEDHEQKT